jgi:hypothetical protein
MSPNSGILVVNGIFGAILSHELFVSRRLPFLVLGILGQQQDNLRATRLGQLRSDLLGNGKERFVLELCIELDLPHGQRLRSENFREFNVAVGRVRIDGRLEYFDAGNIPGKAFGAGRGLDSEQLILTQLHELKKQRKTVILEQLYSVIFIPFSYHGSEIMLLEESLREPHNRSR